MPLTYLARGAGSLSGEPAETEATGEYFIVPLYKNFTYSPKKGILGALDSTQFVDQLKKLKIKAVFTRD